ncbi:Uncharacterized protein BP5553_10113 [Venustampulla echinocandica]|uniref:Uncharacterized protein n=1 Tax=Venustampulla echinocandica TaxID=2656787 RepID=A0A370TAD2_9HELO|nr:Uncharacterized protein BP5553_10113 [Venustampulla echinocandica]RDL30768.1 Uncharacterized protein BP5553_10113 [Venustampulla echinocandica]
MSQLAQNTSLSLPARLLCYLGPPSVILLTTYVSPRTALLSPLAFVPTALCFRKWLQSNERNPSRRGELEPMLWTYAAAGTLGLAGAGLVQIVISKGVAAVLFSSPELRTEFWEEFARSTVAGLTADQLTRRAEIASSWQNWVFNALLTFVSAGLVEETVKYLPIIYARRRGTPKERGQRNRAYLDYALASALSFGLIETIGYMYVSCESANEALGKSVLTLIARVVIGQVGHLSIAALTALRAIRRDYYGDKLSWWRVVGPSVLLHGTYDFIAMSGSALEGNVGWIQPTGMKIVAVVGLITSLVASSLWQVNKEWKALEIRDQVVKFSEDESIEL